MKYKVFVDTNILLLGIFFDGNESSILDMVELNLITSEDAVGSKLSQFICEQNLNPLPDRKALDDIVFDILGLTKDERNEVY